MSHVISHRVINLDAYKHLFANEEAFQEFGKEFAESLEFDFRPIIHNGQVVGSTLSPEGTKELLYSKFAKRISENPEVLEEIVDRIENDEIVD